MLLLPAGWTPRARAADGPWTIGFSQATTLEPWRVEFNKKLEAEAAKHTDKAKLLMADGEDQTTKQVADMDAYIRRQVDLILCSPKESAGLTSVVEQSMDAKIPVILLDRNINSDNYTQFIGGDNIAIGRAAGTFAVGALGGAGKAQGNVAEIWGGLGTSGSHDRSNGFHSVTDKEPGIKYLLNQQSADWKQDKAYEVMSTALRNNEKIDLVFAHNDPMAYGGYLAAKDQVRRRRRAAGRGREVGVSGDSGGDVPLSDARCRRVPASAQAARRAEHSKEDRAPDGRIHEGECWRNSQAEWTYLSKAH